MVSTDDSNIASISQDFGAEVVMRPSKISGDFDSSESALLHVLEQLEQTEAYAPDLIVFLQCTSPTTLPDDIDSTIQKLLNCKADNALAVTEFHYFLWQNNNGDAIGINHDKTIRLMRQERKTQYRETGAVYGMETGGFLKSKHRFFSSLQLCYSIFGRNPTFHIFSKEKRTIFLPFTQ